MACCRRGFASRTRPWLNAQANLAASQRMIKQHKNGIGGVMRHLDAPALAGVHHLKLPVTDLARSREWYRTRLGYQVQIEFIEQGQLMGYGLSHPN
jgi:catechol-2,3-dioxygenase